MHCKNQNCVVFSCCCLVDCEAISNVSLTKIRAASADLASRANSWAFYILKAKPRLSLCLGECKEMKKKENTNPSNFTLKLPGFVPDFLWYVQLFLCLFSLKSL